MIAGNPAEKSQGADALATEQQPCACTHSRSALECGTCKNHSDHGSEERERLLVAPLLLNQTFLVALKKSLSGLCLFPNTSKMFVRGRGADRGSEAERVPSTYSVIPGHMETTQRILDADNHWRMTGW